MGTSVDVVAIIASSYTVFLLLLSIVMRTFLNFIIRLVKLS